MLTKIPQVAISLRKLREIRARLTLTFKPVIYILVATATSVYVCALSIVNRLTIIVHAAKARV